ncbi:MAG: ABC transporter permease, partial [Acidobacteria bacterium]|nr:ABC transporter permease [Acidobacteriota bacterium]
MNFTEAIFIALSSLRANRLRSLLTLLGVVIGIMSVITVVSFITGLNDYVEQRVFTLGPDVFTITRTPQIPVSFEDFLESQRRKHLTMEDFQAVREVCTECGAVGASVSVNSRVKYGREFLNAQIQGYTHEMPGIMGNELAAGRFITEYDDEHARSVCVIGADIVNFLFPHTDPIGKTLMVNDRPLEVIGVGATLGSVFGQSRDNWVMAPLSIHQKIWGSRRSITIQAKALSE